MATFNGTAADDEYYGTESADTINGNGGDDWLEGLGGADTINGGDGHDYIFADAGNDTVDGGAGDDNIFDDAGNDILKGGAGYDILYYYYATGGVTVNLSLTSQQNTGGGGLDTITGFEGISGSVYNDTLTGDAGDNVLEGDAGMDHLSGGDGDDLIWIIEDSHVADGERYSGGAGFDTLYLQDTTDLSAAIIDADIEDLYSSSWVSLRASQLNNFQLVETGRITITDGGLVDLSGDIVFTTDFTLAVGGVTLNLSGSDLASYEIEGSEGVDIVTGGELGDAIYGGGGNDVLYGEGGNDLLEGGDGANQLYGGVGIDQLEGGAGVDLLDGGDDTDILYGGGGADTLLGGLGNDTLFGYEGDDLLEGGLGDDTLTDDLGENQLYGQDGDDTLDAGWYGTGVLDGGVGADTLKASVHALRDLQLIGGAGDDVFWVDVTIQYASELVMDPGGGVDTLSLLSGPGDDISQLVAGFERLIMRNHGVTEARMSAVALDGLSYVEAPAIAITAAGTADMTGATLLPSSIRLEVAGVTLNLTGATSSGVGFVVTGSSGVDNITGGNIADSLMGEAGNDILKGGGGADKLYGQGGLDSFDGGAGDDLLYAGSGAEAAAGETYVGGGGFDTLVFDFGGTVNFADYTVGADIERVEFGGNTHLMLGAAQLNGRTFGGVTQLTINAAGVANLAGSTLAIEQINIAVGGVTLNLAGATGAAYDISGSASADHVTGGALDDQVAGGGGADTLNGDGGADQLYGDGGADILHGGDGGDHLMGGAGADQLFGDAGDDWFEVTVSDIAAGESYSGGDGFDRLYVITSLDLSATTIGTDVEELLVAGGSVTLTAAQLSNFDIVYSDTVFITSGLVADLSAGVAGRSSFGGQMTFDLADVGQTLILPQAMDHENSYWVVGGAGDDDVTGGYLNDKLEGFGGDDILRGGDLNDWLDGGVGDDQLYGGAWHDELHGGDGADQLDGGAGEDHLWGGAGLDVLNGGADNDVFHIASLADLTDGDLILGGGGIDTLLIEFDAVDLSAATWTSIEVIDASALGAFSATAAQLNGLARVNGGDITVTTGGVIDLSATDVWGAFYLSDQGNTLLLPTLQELSANFNVFGGDGADVISGGSVYSSTYFGGGGNDFLAAGAAGYWLYGESGDDTLKAAGGGNAFDGGDGLDTADFSVATGGMAINLAGGQATGWGEATSLSAIENAVGGAHNDVLTGTDGANVLDGGGGDDLLKGGAGVDVLTGGGGIDTADFSDKVSVLVVNLTAQTMTVGGLAEDTLSGIESVIGGSGADILTGNAAANTLNGGGGDDALKGGAGNDTLNGGAGEDTADFSDRTLSVILKLVAGAGAAQVGAGETDTLSGIENVTGGAIRDQITGDGADNDLRGGGGADALNGGGGNDLLDGGAANDVLKGNAGNDTYIVDHTGDVVTEGVAAGTDTVLSSVSWVLGANLENLTLTGTAINGTGNSGNNTIIGNYRANVLIGGNGDDVLQGGDGADRMDGGAGADTMEGGLGNDTYIVSNTLDTLVELVGEGIDIIESRVAWTLADNFENLTLTGTSHVAGTGNSVANTVLGNDGNNLLSGLGGADRLEGNAGADTLVGGDGADILDGGSGLDVFTGGAGVDRFLFDEPDMAGLTAATADRITDFSGDRIALTDLDANTATADVDEAFTFIGTGAFTGVAGQLRYEQVAGNTLITGDTNGDGVADFMIRLDGLHTLSAGHFFL